MNSAPAANASGNTWFYFTLITVFTWGVYGILLHKGQILMGDPENGRYKAFLFVGIAYFLTAVLAPLVLLWSRGAAFSGYTTPGWSWSLIAGIMGAIGAFGTLLAFGAKGSPAAVMSIVFAGAPVVNALLSLWLYRHELDFSKVSPAFYLGLVLALVGGGMVMKFKPNPAPKKPAAVLATPRFQHPGQGLTRVLRPDASQEAMTALQWTQWERLWAQVAAANPFYRAKLALASRETPPPSRASFATRVPFTTKAELVADQLANPPYGTNLTFPLDHYVRCHQTSGTSGAPLRWLDTAESWAAMVEDWVAVFRAAGLVAGDRILFAFSFGPFLGFWLAFEAGQKTGALCFAGGGMSSALRLRVLLENQCTVLCCTPTYALHLAEVAAAEQLDLTRSRIKTLVVAGEPGGSIPATRDRLRAAWNGARIFDHHGMTETGPVTYEHPEAPGSLVVLERSFLAELIDPDTGNATREGETGELVLTTLRRSGSPLIRYRTGDLVRARSRPPGSTAGSPMILEGGILGRVDDMVIVRGVNVYPTAVEQCVRSLPEAGEYRVTLDTRGALAELRIEVETAVSVAAELERRLHDSLALRIPVTAVPAGTLPRFEHKARRWRRI